MMKQRFDFETNIERRSPWTGNVYMVDRMTSEYAERYPLDVDGFLEAVYQKWADCETVGFRETREALRRQWTRTLAVTRPSGDASIYPNQGGEHHPALMEVWGMAGDYWRRGFRLGDVLPAIVPSHTITRLGGGEWIALFPKDAMLLDAASEELRVKSEEFATATESHEIVAATDEQEATLEDTCEITDQPAEQNDAPRYSEPAKSQTPTPSEPVELDLFAQMQAEINQLREENERLMAERAVSVSATEATHRGQSPIEAATTVRRHRRQREQNPTPTPPLRGAGSDDDHTQRNMKIFAAVATAVVMLVLLNTVGLFGIAALGLIAGGVVK